MCELQLLSWPHACPPHADPANPTRRSILHWLVTNIPADGDVSQGEEVRPPPFPPSRPPIRRLAAPSAGCWLQWQRDAGPRMHLGRAGLHAVKTCERRAARPIPPDLTCVSCTPPGLQVSAWRGPNPPTGTHRYVFLLFEQASEEPLQVGRDARMPWAPRAAGQGGLGRSARACKGAWQAAAACPRLLAMLRWAAHACVPAPQGSPASLDGCRAAAQVPAPESIANFSARDFSAEYELGEPIAVTWFTSSQQREFAALHSGCWQLGAAG